MSPFLPLCCPSQPGSQPRCSHSLTEAAVSQARRWHVASSPALSSLSVTHAPLSIPVDASGARPHTVAHPLPKPSSSPRLVACSCVCSVAFACGPFACGLAHVTVIGGYSDQCLHYVDAFLKKRKHFSFVDYINTQSILIVPPVFYSTFSFDG